MSECIRLSRPQIFHSRRTNAKNIYQKEASTNSYNSAMYDTGTVFVTRDITELSPSDPNMNGFPGLIVEHFCVKFGEPSCIGFSDIVRTNRQTNR